MQGSLLLCKTEYISQKLNVLVVAKLKFCYHFQIKLTKPLDFYSERLSALTPGFAGADIANVCNEAALIAARQAKETVDLADFEAAVDRVIGGLEKKNKVISKVWNLCRILQL